MEYIIEEKENGEKIPKILIFDREGRKRVLNIISNYKPYFYILEKEKDKAIELGLKIEETDFTSPFGEKLVKVFTQLPTDVPKFREKFSKTFEADVLFVNRWLIDNYKEEGEKEWRVCFLDIECEDETFPLPTNPINKILSIVCYDNYTQKYFCFIWKDGFEEKTERLQLNGIDCKVFYYKKEEDMLSNFFTFIQDLDFDILVGWNVIRFDLLYLLERAKFLKIKNVNSISPLREVTTDLHYKDVRIRGRSVLDLLEIYKLLTPTQRKSYNLSYISEIELGKSKIGEKHEREYQSTVLGRVKQMWLTNYLELIKYNLWDVHLCVELDKKLGLIEFMEERRKIVGCLFSDLSSSSKIIDILLLRWGRENKIAFPTKSDKHNTSPYEGALVFEPKVGIYENVMSFDFKSLYPSIIQTFNISPETKSRDGEIVLGGVRFTNKREGIIPQLFKNLFELRKKYKSERDKYEKGSREWQIFDRKQMVTKFLINAIYGVMAFPAFRFYDVDCASAVTYAGRMLLSKVKEIVESKGFIVIYGDTDSIFVYKDNQKIEDYLKLCEELNKEVERFIFENFEIKQSFIRLEERNLYSKIIFTKAKKRYVGSIVWSEGKPLPQPVTEVVGFESKRSDTSDYTEQLQNNIFQMLLNGATFEKLVEFVREEVKRVKEGKISYEDIALPKGVRKGFGSYKANTPWVRAVQYSNKYLGTNFQPGDKVKLLWIKDVRGKFPKTDVIAFYDGLYIPDEFVVDWEKMLEVNVFMKLERLFEALGFDFRKVLFKSDLRLFV
ncbi:MAG: DNA-directed DNA polymerase [Candidatus Aenigmatarchaeota archaeon]